VAGMIQYKICGVCPGRSAKRGKVWRL